ncbi:hypothetical protein [Streptomyces aureus]|uniref:hypothetical protein n=1 Tax=Streptomyces aureus TaxID=193461 RepID=UPI0036A6B681
MGSEHLITDEETKRCAERFLSSSPWLGNAEWKRIIIGPQAEFHMGFGEEFPPDAELLDGQSWSWRVDFSDPADTKMTLSHAVVLEGLHKIAYGDHHGSDGWHYLGIKDWFTLPALQRKEQPLSEMDCSMICQWALHGRLVFDVAARAMFKEQHGPSKPQDP